MKKALVLLALVTGCSGNGGGKATIAGQVVDADADVGVPGAVVSLDGRTHTSDAAGAFNATVSVGTLSVVVTKDAYHVVETEIEVSEGNNDLIIQLVACQPGDPAPCGTTPTPTPSATPMPTPNLIIGFDGKNLPNGNQVQAWNGDATITGATMRTIGAGGVGFREAFSECWITPFNVANEDFGNGSGNRTLTTDPRSAIDHCVIRWYGQGDGINSPDAMVEVRVTDDALWTDGSRLDVSNPNVTVAYHEGNYSDFGDFNPVTSYVATNGSMLLIDAGYYFNVNNVNDPDNLVITSSAGFIIPALP